MVAGFDLGGCRFCFPFPPFMSFSPCNHSRATSSSLINLSLLRQRDIDVFSTVDRRDRIFLPLSLQESCAWAGFYLLLRVADTRKSLDFF